MHFGLFYNVDLSEKQVYDALKIEGISHKKLTLYAAVKDCHEVRLQQVRFEHLQALIDMDRVVVIDESALDKRQVRSLCCVCHLLMFVHCTVAPRQWLGSQGLHGRAARAHERGRHKLQIDDDQCFDNEGDVAVYLWTHSWT